MPSRPSPLSRSRAALAGLCAMIALAAPALRAARAQDHFGDIDNLRHARGTTTSADAIGRVVESGPGGRNIILLPGAGFGAAAWADFMSRNDGRYHMLAITPAGFDGTPPPPMPAGTDYFDRPWTRALCDAIARLIRDRGLDSPILAGHLDYGAHLALRVALDHPELVSGVVVVAGAPSVAIPAPLNEPGQPPAPASVRQRRRFVQATAAPFCRGLTLQQWIAGLPMAGSLSRDPVQADALYVRLCATPIPTLLRYQLEYQTTDLGPELDRLHRPLLVVLPDAPRSSPRNCDNGRAGGSSDYAWRAAALTQAWGDPELAMARVFDLQTQWESLRGEAPDLQIVRIPGAARFVMLDQPEAFDAIVADFAAGAARLPAATPTITMGGRAAAVGNHKPIPPLPAIVPDADRNDLPAAKPAAISVPLARPRATRKSTAT